MALGTGEGINILVIVLALTAIHLGVDPDRFGGVRGQKNGLVGLLLCGWGIDILFHGALLSKNVNKIEHRYFYLKTDICQVSCFFRLDLS